MQTKKYDYDTVKVCKEDVAESWKKEEKNMIVFRALGDDYL